MRDLIGVIQQLKAFSSKSEFKRELDKIEDSYYYTAPEARGILWNRVHNAIIDEYISKLNGKPDDECISVISCFSTMSPDEVRKSF